MNNSRLVESNEHVKTHKKMATFVFCELKLVADSTRTIVQLIEQGKQDDPKKEGESAFLEKCK